MAEQTDTNGKSSTPNPAAPNPAATLARERIIPDFSGQRLRLAAEEIPGYHLCWVNDTPGNVAEYQRNGYAFVLQHEQGGDQLERADVEARGTDLGEKVRRHVGTNDQGDSIYAYLMKVEESLFNEGMRIMEKRNKMMHEQLRRAIKEGHVSGESEAFYATKGNKFKTGASR